MGKHSAPTGRNAQRPPAPARDPAPSAADRPSTPNRPSVPRETPQVLKQTAALLTLAVVVVMFALVWTGLGPTAALALGVGLLVLGGVAFLVVRSAGLLSTPTNDPAEEAPAPRTAR